MNCVRVKTLLVSLLEDELSNALKAGVQAHLETCQDCRRERDLLANSWELLDAYEVPSLPDDFTPSLMSRIHLGQAKTVRTANKVPCRSYRLSSWRLAVAAVMLLAATLVLLTFLKRHVSKEQNPDMSQIPPREKTVAITDEEIIRDLDIFVNLELLENLDLLKELEVLENADS